MSSQWSERGLLSDSGIIGFQMQLIIMFTANKDRPWEGKRFLQDSS